MSTCSSDFCSLILQQYDDDDDDEEDDEDRDDAVPGSEKKTARLSSFLSHL
jgi:hypothetical protein